MHPEVFPISPRGYEPHYGDLATLNTGGLILRSLGPELLKSVVADALDVLDTAVAVYEANGDYASGHAVSCWCRLMDQASRGLCETDDNREAMQCGKWHCHEQCWGVARDSMSAGTPIDRPCAGGIRSFAVPILADKEMIGSISVGHGTPPADPPTQRQLADRFHVDLDVLRREARAYEPRTGRDIALAKSRIVTAAQLIGALIEKTRRVREGQTVIDRVQTQLRSMVAERARAESGSTE